MFRAVAYWHSPAVKPGDADFFLIVGASGACQSLFTATNSKRWKAIKSTACSLSSRTTVSQLAVVLRSAQDSGVQLELHAVDAPNLPTMRISAMVGKQHVCSVLLTQAEWSRIRSRISTS